MNKDGRVNSTDTSIVRQNQRNSVISFFVAPPPPPESVETSFVDSLADEAWTDQALSNMEEYSGTEDNSAVSLDDFFQQLAWD